MRIGGQQVDEAIIARMQRVIDEHGELSRTALSRRICEQLKWRSANGKWQEVSCRTALLKLQKAGVLRLAAARSFGARRRTRRLVEKQPEAVIARVLKEIQPVELLLIGSADSAASRVWNELMDRHHYLGSGPLCGAQLRYLIRSKEYGWLGGLSFSAAAWRVRARDEWIGWSDEARQQNLHRLVCNSRFLLAPHVQVPHLASHVLGLALAGLGADFRRRYGYEPLLVETFIDQERFAGTCYRAANFIEVGCTQGRGRQDRAHRGGGSVKRVLVYPLQAQSREQLCAGAQPDMCASVRPVAVEPQDWAQEEFGAAQLPDRRLVGRLCEIARDFYARPQAQIPQACQSRAKTKAAYRFFKHPETKMDVLLEPHRQSTYRRIAEQRVVLCPQDTTSLNFRDRKSTRLNSSHQ